MNLKLFFFFWLLPITLTIAQEFPQDKWNYHDNPEDDGWSISKSQEFTQYLIDSTNITGFIIVHKGKIVFDYGDISENSYIASCRKSVLAMLYGKYVNNGQIDLNKTLLELEIDDVQGLKDIEKKATIKDLISARSGVYHPEGYPGGMQQFAPERGSVKPGSYWLYSNWDFNTAGFIFEQETNKNIYDVVETQLAIPLKMQDWKRELQKKEGDTTISKYLAYPMWFSTRDMARIGLLMLNNGDWNGTEIINKNWVNEMITERTSHTELNKNVPVFKDTRVDFGYGYMWWLWQNTKDYRLKDAYSALGYMGQSITVYPAINVVVAYKTKAAYGRTNTIKTRLDLLKKAVEIYDRKN
ncbi:serine hydrolase [Yeosuana sp. MJ-SS3]|uniref:Serine hydrolase n=1 Tax=Gilvirhabdus luticola TaxID=3079858 RepID=A0ABU3U5U5_9FLAO|nr:serine hydrolase [Yeosuana sp. MJ-SS3]MDU8885784.1 serine hydrolase [Yeosuana sp. MJ-SS3]